MGAPCEIRAEFLSPGHLGMPAALGGQIQISAVFGDDLYIPRGTDTRTA
ncbi:hypothetical protein SXIM_28430 [Streptomyces xiamenensis]|uniref:Uncharacterized protein n=1 Tax=Streptomyces xiamenensis TaxID=408015 RepID=A0A0F7FUP3_9ACTN|nr:hypothetical protein SXIM_28430 [Streptomyces xiamenensis]